MKQVSSGKSHPRPGWLQTHNKYRSYNVENQTQYEQIKCLYKEGQWPPDKPDTRSLTQTTSPWFMVKNPQGNKKKFIIRRIHCVENQLFKGFNLTVAFSGKEKCFFKLHQGSVIQQGFMWVSLAKAKGNIALFVTSKTLIILEVQSIKKFTMKKFKNYVF